MGKNIFKKYYTSSTLLLAVVCFILAGISFFAPKHITTPTNTSMKQTVTPKPTSVLGDTTTIAPTEVVVTQVVYPTTTPLPTQTTTASTTTSTQSSNPQVVMSINEPDGTNNFTIDFRDGMTACDTLTEAKNEGKVKSVTIDSSYQASLHSSYVKEINGYSNNWTFTANGQSPMGCSLYNVQKGDSIVWKYN